MTKRKQETGPDLQLFDCPLTNEEFRYLRAIYWQRDKPVDYRTLELICGNVTLSPNEECVRLLIARGFATARQGRWRVTRAGRELLGEIPPRFDSDDLRRRILFELVRELGKIFCLFVSEAPRELAAAEVFASIPALREDWLRFRLATLVQLAILRSADDERYSLNPIFLEDLR